VALLGTGVEENALPPVSQVVLVAATLLFFETILSFGTGDLPLAQWLWILAGSFVFALAILILGAAVHQLAGERWGSITIILSPVFLATVRGGGEQTEIGAGGNEGLRFAVPALLSVLVAIQVRRRSDSLARFYLIQLLATLAAEASLLIRTVPTLRLVRQLEPRPDRAWTAIILVGVLVFAAGILKKSRWRNGRGVAVLVALTAFLSLGYATQYRSTVPVPSPPSPHRAAPQGVSVVLVVLDTARRDLLSVYDVAGETPNLDRFAANATVFARAFSADTYSLPGYAALFTGRLASEHGARHVPEGESALDPAVSTLAEILRSRGLRTVGLSANFAYLSAWTGLQRGFESFWVAARQQFQYQPFVNTLRARLHAPQKKALDAEYWLSEDVLPAAAAVAERTIEPLFLFVSLMDVHDPYRLPEFPDSRIERRIAQRAAARSVDEQLGGFLNRLRATRHWDDAIVIVTADHGEFFGEHGLDFHFETPLYEPGLQIPMLVKFPRQQTGERHEGIVTQMDVRPMVEAALRGERWLPPSGAGARIVAENWRVAGQPIYSRAVYKGSFKLIQHRERADELFDLSSDPSEARDLMTADPDRARSIRASILRDVPPLPVAQTPKPAEVPSDVLERMRSLGYLR
jgi:arylsulfatase A-like enzyme